MKRFLLLLAVFFLLIVPRASAALAPFEEFKMVLSNDPLNPLSRSQVDTFGLDQTPYLYLKLPENTQPLNAFLESFRNLDWSLSLWEPESGGQSGATLAIGSDTEYWLSPSNWDSIKKVGSWDVQGTYHYFLGGLHGKGQTLFSVAPEPISSILFLFGGAPLATAYIRKRKRL
jgi:hypothetical protein